MAAATISPMFADGSLPPISKIGNLSEELREITENLVQAVPEEVSEILFEVSFAAGHRDSSNSNQLDSNIMHLNSTLQSGSPLKFFKKL